MRKRLLLIGLLVWSGIPNVLAQQQAPALSLQQVIDTYMKNSLELEAARYRVERTKADQIAARLRPNPGLTVTAENLAISGPTPAGRLYEIGATYSETIEFGNKRDLRQKAADANISAAELQFEDAMRRGLADVKRLYLDALLARYNVEVAVENRQTFEQLVQFNLTRFEEGAIPEVDLIKVRLERVKFDSGVRQSELTLRQATIRLLEKLGTANGSFEPRPVSGELTAPPLRFELESLRQFASTERSDVRAAIAEVNAATQRLALERARGKYDISPFAGYKRVGDDNTLLFGVNIPLKIRDQNQAEIARSEADVKAAEARLKIVKNHSLAEVETAWVALQTARELVETFQSELLRQADESRTITLAAYEEGGIELLPVLEAQRTRAEVRQQYFKTLFDYQASVVALELAVGREIQP